MYITIQDSTNKEFIHNLCNEKNDKQLEELIRKPLAFGTAGNLNKTISRIY